MFQIAKELRKSKEQPLLEGKTSDPGKPFVGSFSSMQQHQCAHLRNWLLGPSELQLS
jgi:hypothetical protein